MAKKDKAQDKPVVSTSTDDAAAEFVVTSGTGVEKHVVGVDEKEVREAVEAVKAEVAPVALDINNPAHGNLTDEERQAL